MHNPVHNSLKTEIFPSALVVASFILATYFYVHSPDRVVIHWNFAGQPNGYAGKLFGNYLVPGILLGMYALFLILPNIDPRQERYGEFFTVYHQFKRAIMSVFFIIFVALGLYNIGYPVKINYVVPLAVGALMVVMGGLMRKLKQNSFMGIRTAWTLSSEVVWNKTHRVGGVLFVIFGLCLIAAPFLGKIVGSVLLVAGIIVAIVGSIGYSYLISRERKREAVSTEPTPPGRLR